MTSPGSINKITKKMVAYLLMFTIFFGTFISFPSGIQAQEVSFPDLDSQSAILMEFSRGEIIFSKNGSEPLPPASLTKIMTLLLSYEALQSERISWDEETVVSQKAWETGGSQMFLEIGQKVTIGDLITGIAVVSANDACVAIGEHLYGSEAIFVQEMNKKAAELGLKNTQFQNSSGLPHPDHYTTAEDLAVLSRYLIKNFPEYLKLHSQTQFTFNDIDQYNLNPLLGRYPGADGLKTGHTSEAGHCLAGTAAQDGLRFITVTMNASKTEKRLTDNETMLNYAFRNYTLAKILPAGETITSIRVTGGEERQLDLILENPLETVVPFDRQEDLKLEYNVPESAPAPVEKGAPLGSIEVLLDGKKLTEEPLLAATDIEKAGTFSLILRSVTDFFSGLWQKLLQIISNLLFNSLGQNG
ncbi:MAG TPA: D-alanyl-D-alanine carboxypeptidase [Firmicutes bacterium]|nr:D-alanyl-D-alanine carboxypeptidase [Bacillota bacterium]